MAVVTRDQTTKTLNSRIQLPPTRCALQCTKEEYVESKSSGNMMIHRTWQVIEHAPVKIDEAEIDLSGTELEQYIVLKKSNGNGGFLPNDHADVKKALGRAYADLDAIGYPKETVIDTDNPTLETQGKVVDAMVGSQEQPLYHPPTAEQLAAGKKIGDPQIDSESGKPLVRFKPNLNYILGPSKVEAQQF